MQSETEGSVCMDLQEDFENFWSECPWDEDLKFAQAVCDEVSSLWLSIPGTLPTLLCSIGPKLRESAFSPDIFT